MIIFVVDLIARLDNFDFGWTALNLPIVSLAIALQGSVALHPKEQLRKRFIQ